MNTDILIVGTGCSGLYFALKAPKNQKIIMITKSDVKSNDSFLAQGGICMWHDAGDYDAYFEDTMKAGHYENDRTAVELMIKTSPDVIRDLIGYGVEFQRDEEGQLVFTREGAHSRSRILFHEDLTGKEITGRLLDQVRKMPNVTILEYTTMLDLICRDNECFGAVVQGEDLDVYPITAGVTVLATGGIGGLYQHSTNFRHLTGDALAVAMKHGIALEHIEYVQIHPTTLYVKNPEERSFLISESVRGEGARLYDSRGERFVDELLPRDVLTKKILEQMEKDKTEFVWEDLRTIPREELESHFPNIIRHCRQMGYDVFTECIPVVPAQHYFMGGIKVNHESKTSMDHLYAVGETACNGVHGRNRLASNSLLESLVFAARAAADVTLADGGCRKADKKKGEALAAALDVTYYKDTGLLLQEYHQRVKREIDDRAKKERTGRRNGDV